MNVLFLTLLDFSTIDERGIYTDLMREFVKGGHSVYIISPVEKRKLQPTRMLDNGDYKILKLQIGNIQKTNLIEKGISTITIEPLFLLAIKRYYHTVAFDLILYPTPPITFEKVIRHIKKRDKAKSYLLLKDIFPQNAVDMQMFSKNSLFYKYFRRKEKGLYNVSDFIGCMSKANVKYLLSHNIWIDKAKVEICPNSIEPVTIKKDKATINKIRKKYDIPLDKTIFVYGGNFGKPQGIDFVIECLNANMNNEKAYFLFIGSGTEYAVLEKYFERTKQNNFKLLTQLPKDEYEVLVSSCDVGLIFLDKRFTIPNFPSRILSYMQSSMPIIAATDISSDIRQILAEGEFGVWSESGNVNDFQQNIDLFIKDKKLTIQMGENSRRYLELNYTANIAYEIIMKQLK